MTEPLDVDFIKSKEPSKKELERISQIIRELKAKQAKQRKPRGGNKKKKPSK
jgi:hypothetical protein